MENQVNVNDQNSQQIGQNPSNQSTQIPEKSKIIKYGNILIIVLAVLLLVSASAAGFFYLQSQQKSNEAQPTSSALSSPNPISKPTDKQVDVFEDDRIRVVIPTGWTKKVVDDPVSGTKGIVILAKNQYILTLATHYSQASGIIGGRFEEIDQFLGPWFPPYGQFPCPLKEEAGVKGAQLKINNLYFNAKSADAQSKQRCGNPSVLATLWYGAYWNVNSGYFIDRSSGQMVFTLRYDTKEVNSLPQKGDPKLNQMIQEATQIVKSIVFKDNNNQKSYKTPNFSIEFPPDWKASTRQIEYYDSPTLELTKTGGKNMLGGYELPEIWIGSFEIYSTSGAICANEPYCEKVDKILFSIKGKNYSTDVFKRQIWESGKFTGKYFYVFQIGSQSELDSVPSKPTITGQYETAVEKLEIENILSSITY